MVKMTGAQARRMAAAEATAAASMPALAAIHAAAVSTTEAVVVTAQLIAPAIILANSTILLAPAFPRLPVYAVMARGRNPPSASSTASAMVRWRTKNWVSDATALAAFST